MDPKIPEDILEETEEDKRKAPISPAREKQLLGDTEEPMDESGGADEILGYGKEHQEMEAMSKDDLAKALTETRNKLARAQDENDKLRRSATEARKKDVEEEKQKTQAIAKAIATHERARHGRIADSFEGADVKGARAWRQQREQGDDRVDVGSESSLHPDFVCNECEKRTLKEVLPKEEKEEAGRIGAMRFRTLRELAALLELRPEWGRLSVLEAGQKRKELTQSKKISPGSWTEAYKLGVCFHVFEDVEERGDSGLGVSIEGETSGVSDAISRALSTSEKKDARKERIVLIPKDSVLAKLSGDWKDLDVKEYGSNEDLKKKLKKMRKDGQMPKTVFIHVMIAGPGDHCEGVLELCRKMAEEVESVFYFAGEMLSLESLAIEEECAAIAQQKLTKWRLEEDRKNVVILSQISGLIWKTHPFVNLFVVAGEESKELYEKAVKNVLEGEELPALKSLRIQPVVKDVVEETRETRETRAASVWPHPPGTTTRYAPYSRPSGSSSSSGSGSSSRGSRHSGLPPRLPTLKCYICLKEGHFARDCEEERPIDRPRYE